MFTSRSTLTPRERALQDEVDMLRDSAERERQQQAAALAERRAETRRAHERTLRQAADWPDALRKQSSLCRREADLDEGLGNNFFGSSADACDLAVVWWAEESDARQAQADALRAQLAALEAETRLAVAARLEAHARAAEHGWAHVAGALRSDVDPSAWLDW